MSPSGCPMQDVQALKKTILKGRIIERNHKGKASTETLMCQSQLPALILAYDEERSPVCTREPGLGTWPGEEMGMH